ncbi:MAG TPA: S-adenosylmethionine:tRNA ribosyltransferase-isomerase [Polyangiales bacterium]
MTRDQTRMLLIDTHTRSLGESRVAALSELLRPEDLLVVNDAATLPASLHVRGPDDEELELRLIDAPETELTRAVLFGAGDYHTPTELRPAPPRLAVAASLRTGTLTLTVAGVAPSSPRLLSLRWPGGPAQRFELLYRYGRPVQYSYVPEPLALWDVQTVFATRPWAVEMPSAARPLTARTLLALRERGVRVARLTHAAGLSSTGDPALDAALPLPERYEIPAETAAAVARAQQRGARVVAVGTSVVRALEDSALRHGTVRAGREVAELVLSADTPRRVTTGLVTGIHVPGESHYQLLSAFVDPETLARSVLLAQERGYRAHEFGEAALFLPGLPLRHSLAA